MTSFDRTPTPILPTRQIHHETRSYENDAVTLEFFVFGHIDSDIIELVVLGAKSEIEYEHVYLSKKAILEQVDDELVNRFELARHNRVDNDIATEEEILELCTDEMIGEFVVDQVSIDPKNASALLLAPVKDPTEVPMSILALKPHGKSNLEMRRSASPGLLNASPSEQETFLSTTSSVSPSLSSSHRAPVRQPSLVLKAVDAFKHAVAQKKESDVRRSTMHPAKGRFHKSVKTIMLQNAVEKVKEILGRPQSDEWVDIPAENSEIIINRDPPKKMSSLESTKLAIAARRNLNSP